MRHHRRLALPAAAVALLSLGAASRPQPPAPAVTAAFVRVNVVAMTTDDALLRDQTVLVAGDRIVASGPSADVVVPPTAQRIDGHDGFLLPGLIDLHAHPWRPEDLPLMLAFGVTRALAPGFPGLLGQEWSQEIAAGERLGPALHVCAPAFVGLKTREEARQRVADAAADGFRCIKVYDDISTEAYGELVAAARERGMLAISHIPRNLGWPDMLAAPPSAVAHTEEFLYSPCCEKEERERIVATMRERGIALITTLSNYDRIVRQAGDREGFLALLSGTAYYSPAHRRTWARFNRYRSFSADSIARLRYLLHWEKGLVRDLAAGGVRVLAGTDSGNSGTIPGASMVSELQAIEEAGLARGAALAAATREAAAFLGVGAEVGTVEPGRRADLLLLWGNPLESLTNLELSQGVMVGGRWIPRAEQLAMLRELRRGFAGEEHFIELLDERGIDAAVGWYEEQVRQGGVPPLALIGLNELGYGLLRNEGRQEDALRLFRLETASYPQSWVAWDSLADALETTGDTAGAVDASRRSLELQPRNRDAAARLRRLTHGTAPAH